MRDVTAIIVTHNSREHVAQAVRSCLGRTHAIVVVDNASTDGTLQALAGVSGLTILSNPRNLGFAGGVNQGIRASRTPLILLLNPDAELLDALDPLVGSIVEDGHAAAAGLLVDGSLRPQRGFSIRRLPGPAALAFEVLGINRVWPGNPVNRWYRCLDIDLTRSGEVEQPAAAFFLVRREVWEQLGGFDEEFHPVWFEDVDFCRRLHNSGGKIHFDPSVRARHEGGHSVQKVGFMSRQVFWYGSLLKYAAKHFSPNARRIVAVAVAAATIPRSAVAILRESIRPAVCTQAHIMRLAWRCFWSGRRTEERLGTEARHPGES